LFRRQSPDCRPIGNRIGRLSRVVLFDDHLNGDVRLFRRSFPHLTIRLDPLSCWEAPPRDYVKYDKVLFTRSPLRFFPCIRGPSGALVFVGCLAVLLALTGTFEELYSLFVFAVWIFFALTAISLFYLRKKEPDVKRPYRAWGYPWSLLVFLVAALALTVNLGSVRPIRSSLGMAVMLAGIPFFYRWRKALSAQPQKVTLR